MYCVGEPPSWFDSMSIHSDAAGWPRIFTGPLPVARLFRLYFGRVVPLLGGLVTGHPYAYRYLPESVERFRDAEGLARLLAENGFEDVSFTRLGLGSIALHHGVRSP